VLFQATTKSASSLTIACTDSNDDDCDYATSSVMNKKDVFVQETGFAAIIVYALFCAY